MLMALIYENINPVNLFPQLNVKFPEGLAAQLAFYSFIIRMVYCRASLNPAVGPFAQLGIFGSRADKLPSLMRPAIAPVHKL